MEEIAARGVEIRLCSIHAEWEPVKEVWKWDTMDILAVGPMPDPGQRMAIGTHALTALYHPQQIDKEASKLEKGFVHRHFKYNVPDPDEFAQLDMYEEQWELETQRKLAPVRHNQA